MQFCPFDFSRPIAIDYRPPEAAAIIKGGPLAPDIQGVVTFKDVPGGTEVCADIWGLPPYQPGTKDKDPIGPHGFHIHQNGTCDVGDPQEPFKSAGEHWNPTNQPHGNHVNGGTVTLLNNYTQPKLGKPLLQYFRSHSYKMGLFFYV